MKNLLFIALLLGALCASCGQSTVAPDALTAAQLAAARDAERMQRVEHLASQFYSVPFDNHLWVVFAGWEGSASYSFKHHPDCYCRALCGVEAGE